MVRPCQLHTKTRAHELAAKHTTFYYFMCRTGHATPGTVTGHFQELSCFFLLQEAAEMGRACMLHSSTCHNEEDPKATQLHLPQTVEVSC